eukprot:Phypoly_transcript_05674.p1 GENE.Phypoly_transcript_05674~~Phypoly_transcript_05674.p1  ORF type:complete len:615 (+),score=110.03 Phypoly_transcript_05674:35-1879(+)
MIPLTFLNSPSLLVLFLTCTYANIVSFNKTASYLCNPSCEFNNSAIWLQGDVPKNGDQVFIDVADNIQVEITNSTITTLDLLSLSGSVSFTLVGYKVEFVSCTVDEGASLVVQAGGTFISKTSFWLGDNCTLKLTDNSIFEQGLNPTFSSSPSAIIEVHNTAGMFMASVIVPKFSGSLYFGSSVQLVAAAIDFESSTIVFEGSPQFETANFGNSNAQFLGGFSSTVAEIVCTQQSNITIIDFVDLTAVTISQGSEIQILNATGYIADLSGAGDPGTLVISSANNVTISAANISSIGVSLHLAGNTSLTLQNIILPTNLSFGPGYFGEPAEIYLNLEQKVVVAGNYTIPGQIFLSGGHLTTSGSLTITGGIQALGAKIEATGALTAGEPVILDKGSSTNTSTTLTVTFPAHVRAPFFQIQNNSRLQTEGNVTISGSVTNLGIFQVVCGNGCKTTQNIYIEGNYTQLEGGTFVAYLNKNFTSTVHVSDSVHLEGGTIAYVFAGNISKNEKFEILEAKKRLIGQFTNNGSVHAYEPSGLPDVENLGIQYEKNSVYLLTAQGHESIFKLWGLEWWIWAAVLAAVVLLLIAAIILSVIKVRASKKYLKYQIIPGASSIN